MPFWRNNITSMVFKSESQQDLNGVNDDVFKIKCLMKKQ